MALKIIQLEAKYLAGQYLGFLVFNVSALSSKGDMRTEGGMKEISSADLRGLLETYPTFGREKETGLLGALDT